MLRDLYLEDNLKDIDIKKYTTITMDGCIFTNNPKVYYDTCKLCGLPENDPRHKILFDLNVRFILSKIDSTKYEDNNNMVLVQAMHSEVYPGIYTINLTNYKPIYTKNDYFKLVRQIVDNF